MNDQYFQKLHELVPLQMCVLGKNLDIRYANTVFKDSFGSADAEGKTWTEVVPLLSAEEFLILLERARDTLQIEQEAIKTSGEYEVEYNVIVRFDPRGEEYFVVMSREQSYKSIRIVDGLTGLPNRELFKDRVSQLINRAERDGLRVAILFMDLNGFKPVNDTYGHKAGDAVLKTVAERIQTGMRKTDTAARFGGDEFVMALSDLKVGIHANLGAKRILSRIEKPIDIGGGIDIRVSASMGIAIYPEDGREVLELIKKADEAMYRSKKEERSYCFFDMDSVCK